MIRSAVTRSLRRVAALSLLAVPLCVHADDASKRTKVDQMLTLSKVDSVAQQMLANVPARVKQAASRQVYVQSASTDEQKKITADYLQQMGDIAQKGANWDTIHPKIVDLYMQAFTESDLDGILAFYKTPAGQALVTKTPELSGRTIELLQGSVNAMEPDFKAATLAYETKMKNASPQSTPEKAPTLGPATPTTPTLKPRQ